MLKKLFVSCVLLCIIITSIAQNQQLILLDYTLEKEFDVRKYTLNSKELYGVDNTIEMYNLIMDRGKVIMLLSVLPDFTSNENWEKIDMNIMMNQIVPSSNVAQYVANQVYRTSNTENSFMFKLVKKTDSGYYMSKRCFVEIFMVRHYPTPLVTPFKTLNTASPKITMKEMLQKFPEYISSKNRRSLEPDSKLLRQMYLSKAFYIGEKVAYQYWTLINWGVIDGWDTQRGIDRLLYIPGKGIVGGSYDFWFAFKPVQAKYIIDGIPVANDKLWDNAINEKIMLAEELKEEME